MRQKQSRKINNKGLSQQKMQLLK